MTKSPQRNWSVRGTAIALGLSLLAVGMSIPAHAQESPRCHRNGTQTEMNICASEAYQKANTQMWQLYQKKMDYLRSDYSRARLKEAQRLWMQYRDASCLYENGLEQDAGTMWKQRQLDCMTDHTKRRSGILKSYVSCTKDEDCPI